MLLYYQHSFSKKNNFEISYWNFLGSLRYGTSPGHSSKIPVRSYGKPSGAIGLRLQARIHIITLNTLLVRKGFPRFFLGILDVANFLLFRIPRKNRGKPLCTCNMYMVIVCICLCNLSPIAPLGLLYERTGIFEKWPRGGSVPERAEKFQYEI